MNVDETNIEKKDDLNANINNTSPKEKYDEKENITIKEEKKDKEKTQKQVENYKYSYNNDCSECCKIICVIICSIIMILLELALNFILAFIFIYYKKNHKQCEAKLYPKINSILYIYLTMLIISVLIMLITIIISTNEDRCNENLAIFSLVFTVLFGIAMFALQLTNLIIVQKYYNKSKNWDNCGKFKGWSVFWLVMNYISLIIGMISRCLKARNNRD